MPNSSEQNRILWLLHAHDEWHEELLSSALFGVVIDDILSRRERFILEERVRMWEAERTTAEAIEELKMILHIKDKTIRDYCTKVKFKLRNHIACNTRSQFHKYLEG